MSSTMSTQADVAVMREEAARAGERIYERRLKAVLEADSEGRVVAIHIPSEDYSSATHSLKPRISFATSTLWLRTGTCTRGASASG